MKTAFVRKASDLDEVIEYTRQAHSTGRYETCTSDYYIAEKVTLSEIEWRSLASCLLADRDWIAAFSKREYPSRDGAQPCIRVACKSDSRVLIIDPQGYDYARYVSIEEKPGALK